MFVIGRHATCPPEQPITDHYLPDKPCTLHLFKMAVIQLSTAPVRKYYANYRELSGVNRCSASGDIGPG